MRLSCESLAVPGVCWEQDHIKNIWISSLFYFCIEAVWFLKVVCIKFITGKGFEMWVALKCNPPPTDIIRIFFLRISLLTLLHMSNCPVGPPAVVKPHCICQKKIVN